MATCQFIRCHAYQANKISGVLAEANRDPGFTSHVENPRPPNWHLGSKQLVEAAVLQYMAQRAPVKGKNGNLFDRKRRYDHRCLVAGTVSWPDTIEMCASSDYASAKYRALKKWFEKTLKWLQDQFSENLIAMCAHKDESHPHIHFFVVGDAQRLHPGMKNELVNDVRRTVSTERIAMHKEGLKAWLDDFHACVGGPCGLERSLGSRPVWRIADRGARLKLLNIEKALLERPDELLQEEAGEVWDELQKKARPRMVF